MSLLTECPSCSRKLRLPEDLLGKAVKCPARGQQFRAGSEVEEAAPRPVPDDEAEFEEEEGQEDDEEAPRRRIRGNRAAWRKVHTGLTLIVAAIVMLLLAFPLAIVAVIALGPLAAVPLGLFFLVAGITWFIGNVFCVAAPPKYNAKSFAITILALAILSFALSVLSAARPHTAVEITNGIIALAQLFLNLCFLRAVARCIRSHDLEDSIGKLIVLSAVLVVAYFVLATAVAVGGPNRPGAGAARGGGEAAGTGELVFVIGSLCTFLILFFVWLFWFVRVLTKTRTELGYHISRR